MKRKLIVLSFMLSFLAFINEMQAQNDAYFSTSQELRSPDAMGLSFDGFSGQFGYGFNFSSFETEHDGFDFEGFTGGDTPLANGLLIMTATGLIYLMNKRRKENEK